MSFTEKDLREFRNIMEDISIKAVDNRLQNTNTLTAISGLITSVSGGGTTLSVRLPNDTASTDFPNRSTVATPTVGQIATIVKFGNSLTGAVVLFVTPKTN